jgi:GNAT superfamily N-acetyltransferase
VSRPYRIVPWDQIAGRATFTCGKAEIDAYWRTMAVRHAREGLAAVMVMEEATTGEVVGYCTMVSYTLVVETLPAHFNPRKLPNRLPTTLVGKLAIHADRQRQGLGTILLSHAIASAVGAGTRTRSYAIVVDAIDDDAARFYGRFGFLPLEEVEEGSLRLLLPMANARNSQAGSRPPRKDVGG